MQAFNSGEQSTRATYMRASVSVSPADDAETAPVNDEKHRYAHAKKSAIQDQEKTLLVQQRVNIELLWER